MQSFQFAAYSLHPRRLGCRIIQVLEEPSPRTGKNNFVIFSSGGGIFNDGFAGGTATVELSGGTISNNTSEDNGGGIYNLTGTVTGSFNGKGLPGGISNTGYSFVSGTGWAQDTETGDAGNTKFDIYYPF